MDTSRREFLRLSAVASGAALAGPGIFAQSDSALPVRLTVRPDRLGESIGQDFIGLSYESAQLGNPDFFSGANQDLIGFLRTLSRGGVLRVGGNTSEFCHWTPEGAKPPDESALRSSSPEDKTTGIGFSYAVGPDTGRKAPPPAAIRPLAIRNLRDFLDATGWRLIYGLNLGTGTPQIAAEEAAYVRDTMGEKLLAFQLGNEPDLFYRNGLRGADYNFDQFAREWQQFYDAIQTRVPDPPMAGPDTAYNTAWLVPFAQRFKANARYLSQHYYALGPPSDESMTIERLLRPNPKLQDEFKGMQETVRQSGLPFRLAETNSCYQGGKPGVSDTFASALWGGDLMYQLAAAGGQGIHFHGGGYGWYTPVAGTQENGFLARPLYYGMLLFAQAGAGRLLASSLDPTEDAPLLTAYALGRAEGGMSIVAFNKYADRGVQLHIDAGKKMGPARALRLYAPRLEDRTDTTLGGAVVGAKGGWAPKNGTELPAEGGVRSVEIPAASAVLVTFQR